MSASAAKIRFLEKQQHVLGFLRDETYSTARILGQVMGVESRSAIHRSLKRLQTQGVIRQARVSLIDEAGLNLWGITVHGLGLSLADQVDAHTDPERAFFTPGKINLKQLQHKLDIQVIRVAAERAGWSEWVSGHRTRRKSQVRVPDATARHPKGWRVAIEVERSLKSQKRYSEIIGDYLWMMHQQQLDAVYYACPTGAVMRALKRMIQQLKTVRYAGTWEHIDACHLSRFYFLNYGESLACRPFTFPSAESLSQRNAVCRSVQS